MQELMISIAPDKALFVWKVPILLAHLYQRLRMSYYDHLPPVSVHAMSVFCLSLHPSFVHLPAPLTDFSETPGPIFFKLHVEPSVKGRLKIYKNGHSLLIKMATMPIYGKHT